MDRLATLAQRAHGLTHSLGASLPWGYRLASVFVRMVTANPGLAEAWGRQLGVIFLSAGVTDMPDPGPRWNPARPNPGALPSGYLKREAIMAYQVALKKTGNPSDAEDILQDALLKVMEGGTKIKAMPLRSALSFFVTSVGWAADNAAKKKRRRKDDSLDHGKEDDDGEGAKAEIVDNAFDKNPYWVEDPDDYRMLGRLFTPSTWRSKVTPALAKVHQDMPLFFEKMLDDPHAKMTEAVRSLPNYPAGQEHKGYVTWLNWLRGKVAPLLKELAEDVGDGPALAHTASAHTASASLRQVTVRVHGATLTAHLWRQACGCSAPATMVESTDFSVPEGTDLAPLAGLDMPSLTAGLIEDALARDDAKLFLAAHSAWADTYTKVAGLAPGERAEWLGQALAGTLTAPEAQRPVYAALAQAAFALADAETFDARTKAAASLLPQS